MNKEEIRKCFKVAACQFPCQEDYHTNLQTAEDMVRRAARDDVHLVLLQELFAGLYFCQHEDPIHFQMASVASHENPLFQHFMKIAKELHIIIPISFYEKKNQVYFNSIIVIDADGCIIDVPSNGGKIIILCIFIST